MNSTNINPNISKEDKALLIKDLSARIPYAVEVLHTSGFSGTLHNITVYPLYDQTKEEDVIYDYEAGVDFFGDGDYIKIEYIRPYLFPLSSMTDEQKRELRQMDAFVNTFGQICFSTYDDYGHELMPTYEDAIRITKWLIKNHFDYMGLIPKDLAIDATGKGIY